MPHYWQHPTLRIFLFTYFASTRLYFITFQEFRLSKFHGNVWYFPSCFLSSDKLANRGKFLDISVKFPETWRLFPKALSKLLLYFNHSPLSEFLVWTLSQYFQRSTQVVWKTLQGNLPANAPPQIKNIVIMLYALHNLTR